MNSRSYKQRLTSLGNWGVVLAVTMPFFALFFFAVYYCYAADWQGFASYTAGATLQAETIAATFAYGAAISGVLAAVGIVMICRGREVYVAEDQDDTHLPHCGLRELCAAA